MLFDTAPKERREDLYDREKELNEASEALRLGERLVIVYGIRRIGKSSLVKVILNETLVPHVIVDVREIYYKDGSIPEARLVKRVLEGFRDRLTWYKRVGFDLREALKKIKKVRVGDFEIEVKPGSRVSLTEVLSGIDSWCGEHGMRFVFVFDEAQYLRFSNVRYDGLLAWAVDNLRNTTFILTGSEAGVLREFLRINDAEAPLFGRYRREIYLERFSKEQSTEFLRKGFEEVGVEPDVKEIEEAVRFLDGIVGWLTYYGYYRGVRKLKQEEVIPTLLEEGSKMVLAELEKIITPSRERYVAILKAIAQGASAWSDVKAYVVAKSGPVNDARFTELLTNLVKYGYVVKENNNYRIPDPIVKHAVLEKLHL